MVFSSKHGDVYGGLKDLFLVASFFKRDFDHKLIFEVRHPERNHFCKPERARTKLFFQVISTTPFLTRVAPIESWEWPLSIRANPVKNGDVHVYQKPMFCSSLFGPIQRKGSMSVHGPEAFPWVPTDRKIKFIKRKHPQFIQQS